MKGAAYASLCCLWWCWKGKCSGSSNSASGEILSLCFIFKPDSPPICCCIFSLPSTLPYSHSSPFTLPPATVLFSLALFAGFLFHVKSRHSLSCTLPPITHKFAFLFSFQVSLLLQWVLHHFLDLQPVYVCKSHYSLFQCLSKHPTVWCRDWSFTSDGLWAQSHQGGSSSMQSCWQSNLSMVCKRDEK